MSAGPLGALIRKLDWREASTNRAIIYGLLGNINSCGGLGRELDLQSR